MRLGGAYRRKIECWEASKIMNVSKRQSWERFKEILRRVFETLLDGGPGSNAALQQLTMKSLGKERDLSGTVVNPGNCVFDNKESAL